MTRMIYDPDYDDTPAPDAYDMAVADAERLYRENAALRAKLDRVREHCDHVLSLPPLEHAAANTHRKGARGMAVGVLEILDDEDGLA